MPTIKFTALTSIAIISSLVLLLTPDSLRNRVPVVEVLPDPKELPAIGRQSFSIRDERSTLAQTIFEDAPPEVQVVYKLSADSATSVSSTDWPLVLYPELGQIEALEDIPAEAALGEIIPMMASDDPVIRLAAIEAIGDMTISATANVLMFALDDPNSQLRVAAIEALASQEDHSAIYRIELLLHDADRDVRIAAIEALASFEDESAVNALAGLLADPDAEIRQQTIYALGEIGGELAASYLRQAQYDSADSVRASAVDILAELEFATSN